MIAIKQIKSDINIFADRSFMDTAFVTTQVDTGLAIQQ